MLLFIKYIPLFLFLLVGGENPPSVTEDSTKRSGVELSGVEERGVDPNLVALNYGSYISLLTHHMKYVSVNPSGNWTANKPWTQIWETFRIMNGSDLSDREEIKYGDRIRLLSHHKKYMHGKNDKSSLGLRTRGNSQNKEDFILLDPENVNSRRVLMDGSKIALKSGYGRYVVAEPNGTFIANRSQIGSWEKFTVEAKPIEEDVNKYKYKITVKKLECLQTHDIGRDEVYITLKGPHQYKRIPETYKIMNEQKEGRAIQTWDVNGFTLDSYDGLHKIELQVQESDILIGTVGFSPSDIGNFSKTFERSRGFKYKVSYSVERSPRSINEFTMAFISDPQYDFCVEDVCKDNFGNANLANKKHAESLQKLQSNATSIFRGVVVNGDITNVASSDELTKYITQYKWKFNTHPGVMYPGLGNHDYKNYWKSWCAGPDAGSKYYCTYRMLTWLEREVNELEYTNFDHYWKKSNHQHIGSFSYSWDVGQYHFIQLNLHPNHAIDFRLWVSSKGRYERFDVNKSYEWLKEDLKALDKSKQVVINLHAMHAGDGLYDNRRSQNDPYDKFVDVLADYAPSNNATADVLAIFAGHIHHRIMQDTMSYVKTRSPSVKPAPIYANWRKVELSNTESIPVFYCGSSDWSKYLKVNFSDENMKISAINSENGLDEIFPTSGVREVQIDIR